LYDKNSELFSNNNQSPSESVNNIDNNYKTLNNYQITNPDYDHTDQHMLMDQKQLDQYKLNQSKLVVTEDEV